MKAVLALLFVLALAFASRSSSESSSDISTVGPSGSQCLFLPANGQTYLSPQFRLTFIEDFAIITYLDGSDRTIVSYYERNSDGTYFFEVASDTDTGAADYCEAVVSLQGIYSISFLTDACDEIAFRLIGTPDDCSARTDALTTGSFIKVGKRTARLCSFEENTVFEQGVNGPNPSLVFTPFGRTVYTAANGQIDVYEFTLANDYSVYVELLETSGDPADACTEPGYYLADFRNNCEEFRLQVLSDPTCPDRVAALTAGNFREVAGNSVSKSSSRASRSDSDSDSDSSKTDSDSESGSKSSKSSKGKKGKKSKTAKKSKGKKSKSSSSDSSSSN